MSDHDSIPDWDISALVASEELDSVRQEFDGVFEKASEFQSRYRGRIPELDSLQVRNLVQELEDIQNNARRIHSYSYMRFSVNPNDADGQALNASIQGKYAELQKLLAFVEIGLTRLLKRVPGILNDSTLSSYRYYLTKLCEKSPYLLSEEIEQLILEKNRYGANSWFQLQSEFRGTAHRFTKVGGEEKDFGLMELLLLIINSPDREIRKSAADALYTALSDSCLALSYAYRSVCNNYASDVKRRGWADSLSPILHIEGIDRETIENMWHVVEENTSMIRAYLKLKASIMGIDRVGNWDLWAPIAELDRKFNWKDAREIVVDAYSRFDSDVGSWVDELFSQNRIHARPGKIFLGGCAAIYNPNLSWVIINFTGALNDLIGLAHESGHGYHSFLNATKNSFLNWSSVGLCLSETASVFGELLMLDKLLTEADDQLKINILCKILDNFRLLTYEMLWRFNFERKTFDAIDSGAYLNADAIANLWVECRMEVFGDSIEWHPDSKWEWGFLVHNFMTDYRYYNFSYAFGQLLVFALYNRYRTEGESFIPMFKQILEFGGSASPKDILATVGFDISRKGFWEIGNSFAIELLEQLERLVDK